MFKPRQKQQFESLPPDDQEYAKYLQEEEPAAHDNQDLVVEDGLTFEEGMELALNQSREEASPKELQAVWDDENTGERQPCQQLEAPYQQTISAAESTARRWQVGATAGAQVAGALLAGAMAGRLGITPRTRRHIDRRTNPTLNSFVFSVLNLRPQQLTRN